MTGERGFTLVEMLVAVVVAALMATAAHRGIRALSELAGHVNVRTDRVDRAAAVRRQLQDWLRSVPASDGWGIKGERGTARSAPADVLEFRTRSADPFRLEDARVRIGFDPGSGSIVAEVAVAGGPAERRVLVPRAEGLRMRYYYDAGGVFRWTDEWVSAATLPRAVEIRIIGDSIPPLLQLPVLVPVGGAG